MGPWAEAFKDLCARYVAVLAHAWRHRHLAEAPSRPRHEVQFLPAALSLQETPVHPAPRVAMGLILVFASIALLWAVFGHVDVVATASGRIVPDSRSKLVQPTGVEVVRAIHVRDGQVVRAGDPLIEFDATDARADMERLRGEYVATMLEVERNRALLSALERDGSPGESSPVVLLPARLADEFGIVRVQTEQGLVEAQFRAYESARLQLDAEIDKREAERLSALALVEKLQRTLPIVTQRASDYRGLMEKRFVSRHGYLELEQARIERERDLAAQQARLVEIAASKTEAERQRERLRAETRREWMDRAQVGEERAFAYRHELNKAKNRDRLTRLASPVDGMVQQLSVHTIGGVVTPAQTLMVIVPLDSPLEVHALLLNKDVGFVRPGQDVEVKVETFPFTKYGTVAGTVINVSSDSVNDERLGAVFATRVLLARDVLLVEGRAIRLSAGMAVTVEVKTGKRRVIEFFLGPLLQYSQEGLRER